MKGVMGENGSSVSARNKANFRPHADPEIGVPGQAGRAKQSQFVRGRAAPWLGAIVQNKANCPRCPEMGAHGRAWDTAGDRLCQTKPIGEGIGVQGGLPIAMNCDWEPGSGISDLTPDTRPLTPALSCETKPISARTIKDGEGYRPVFRRRR